MNKPTKTTNFSLKSVSVAETLTPSTEIPSQLAPFIKMLLGGLFIVAAIIGFAIVRQRYPEVFIGKRTSLTPTQTPGADVEIASQTETESFIIDHPSGLYKSYQGSLLRFFPNEETANNFESCLKSNPNFNPGDCQLVMLVAIEQYPADYDNSLERIRNLEEQNMPTISSFTDDKGRAWLKTTEVSSSSGYTQTAETKTETGIHLLSIEVSLIPYQSLFQKDLTPESLSELINNMLSTVEFTNQ